MEKDDKRKSFLPILLISVFFALLAGIVGELLARSYLINSAFNIPLLGEINVSDTNPDMSNFVIREAKKVVVEQNDKTAETANAVSGSLVGIYKKKTPGTIKNFDLSNYYTSKEVLGQGLIITSDGWIITNSSFILEKPDSYKNYVVVTKDKKNYQIDKVITDKLTKFYFIHISAKDLPVRKFAEPKDIKNGQTILSVSQDSSIIFTSLVNGKKYNDLISFTDKFNDNLILSDNLSKEWRGPAVFNMGGDIVGLVNEDGKVESIRHLNNAISSIFKNKEIKRSSLGLYYIQVEKLNEVRTVKDAKQGLPTKGAMVAKNPEGIAVIKGSPAEAAGLKEGDVITLVENNEVDQITNLTDAIQEYAPGTKVNITYLRQGEEKEAELVLGELK
ncbi:MAG: Trypsin [Parcubacteria group bacterium GW2011_GWE2_39_37]|uniref:Trypsin n=1 Tax=Candidatus Falkowbacteria bacterium GW2011_GWF2_39_8 TaxID=1618642 RepID=A0A0G0PT12_9BACT|nr:MAG: Trypsin [Parcubacteria group bacterium GW2011_GWE2_39_37]KKR31304.1 MAG: Trypsin [Candidatus Falkowbacteria bacterium GW2011_GWF2_39_8]